MQTRKIKKLLKSKPTIEGAGVHLKRAFGFNEAPGFDPFLMLDDFRADDPRMYIKGFPWHPHRGIETISYILRGTVAHGDSMGNKGAIGAGDVQWMTAGSGIIHQEMPSGDRDGFMWGFQLWANLPASDKMMPPRYRDVTAAQIPEIRLDNGTAIKIIAGTVNGTTGPVRDIVIDPEFLDIAVPASSEYKHKTKKGHTVFAFVIDGGGYFDGGKTVLAENGNVVLFDDGDEVAVATDAAPARFLLLSGKPLNEPVAWHGPIVMNTREELETAFEEYEKGTFIK
jgi:quercetin 2,3-dioxygenase